MKKEYDFSKAERGKFYRPDTELNLPVYLDEDVMAFVQGIAEKRDTDPSSVANQLLRGDMQLAEAMKQGCLGEQRQARGRSYLAPLRLSWRC